MNGDELRLVQVLDNLLNNAAKFTPNGGRIALSVARDDAEVVVRVADTGVGIRPDVLPHVFGLFKQADSTLARASGGLGIGLTIVKGLVDMHGGRIAVTSEVGIGSTFEVRLPAAASPASAARPDAAPQTAAPARILIVEDNEDAAESLALLLALNRHQVDTRHDGAAALEALAGLRPEVILVDIGLPGIDGYAFARAVRQRPDHAHCMLVAVSGYGSAEDKAKSAAAGFDAHLVKPVDFETLTALLASRSRHAAGGARLALT